MRVLNVFEEVMWVFVGQRAIKLQAVQVGGINKTKDWALVQTAALAINQGFNVRFG